MKRLPPCPKGQERNKETRRCRKSCVPPQVRDETTGKCRNEKKEKAEKVPRKKSFKKSVKKDKKSKKAWLPKRYKPSRDKDHENDSCITSSKMKLAPHQRRVVSFLQQENARGLLVVHGVGTGKTLTAVTASQCFLQQDPDHHVIVVTPTSLQQNFVKELKTYGTSLTDRYTMYTIQGFSSAVKKDKKVSCDDNTLLILDEAHNIRSEVEEESDKVGVYARNLIECAKRCKKVLLLTATPIINRPSEIVNLIGMIDGEEPIPVKDLANMSDEDFRDYVGCKISMYSRDMKKHDPDYPSSTNHDVFLTMNPSYAREYKKIEDSGEPKIRTFYNGARRASNALEGTKSKKIEWIMDHMGKSKEGDKYVIFSHFLGAGLDLLKTRMKQENIPFLHITGDVTMKTRAEAVAKYNKGDIKVLLISKAGGEGLDLKNTKNMIVMEPAWNESTHMQVIGRAVRKGSHASLPESKRHVDIYRLFHIKPDESSFYDQAATELWDEHPIPGQKLSVDLYLRNVAYNKQEEIDGFLEKIRKLSIEKNKC
jgi:SNF2 family DNA or RNA helicase